MRWVRVEGAHARCSCCGAFPVDIVWRLFDGEATWLRDWCEACVEKKLNEKGEA